VTSEQARTDTKRSAVNNVLFTRVADRRYGPRWVSGGSGGEEKFAGQRVGRERRDQCGQQKIISELVDGGHGKAGSQRSRHSRRKGRCSKASGCRRGRDKVCGPEPGGGLSARCTQQLQACRCLAAFENAQLRAFAQTDTPPPLAARQPTTGQPSRGRVLGPSFCGVCISASLDRFSERLAAAASHRRPLALAHAAGYLPSRPGAPGNSDLRSKSRRCVAERVSGAALLSERHPHCACD
jgi:hypothetical protein